MDIFQILDDQLTNNALTMVFYPENVDSGLSELRNQAKQFAIDHNAIGIVNNELQLGVAYPIGTESAWAIMERVQLKIENELIGRNVRFSTLSIHTHGEYDQIQIAPLNGNFNGWIKNSVNDFAKKIAPHLSSNLIVTLYTCNAAGPTNYNGIPFSEKLRSALYNELNINYGADTFVQVWGHKDKGHTTANNRLVQFSGSGNYNGGNSLLDDFAWWVFNRKMEEFGLSVDSLTSIKREEAIKLCYSHMLRAYGGFGRNRDEKQDSQGRYYTSPSHPVNTFIREIPFRSIDQVWLDTTQGEMSIDVSTMPLTDSAKERYLQGVNAKQKRFLDEYNRIDLSNII